MTINGATRIGATSGVTYAGGLTPDALMQYCATRLRGIGDQVDDQFEKQEWSREVTGDVNELQQKLVALFERPRPNKEDAILAGDQATKDDIRFMFDEVIKKFPDGHPQKEALKAQFAQFDGDAKDGGVGGTQLRAMAEGLQTISKDLSSGAELEMITLQSIMSQRQTAIQICTNLVAALGESSKAIAQKIGS